MNRFPAGMISNPLGYSHEPSGSYIRSTIIDCVINPGAQSSGARLRRLHIEGVINSLSGTSSDTIPIARIVIKTNFLTNQGGLILTPDANVAPGGNGTFGLIDARDTILAMHDTMVAIGYSPTALC